MGLSPAAGIRPFSTLCYISSKSRDKERFGGFVLRFDDAVNGGCGVVVRLELAPETAPATHGEGKEERARLLRILKGCI